jgi:hypothetical protein
MPIASNAKTHRAPNSERTARRRFRRAPGGCSCWTRRQAAFRPTSKGGACPDQRRFGRSARSARRRQTRLAGKSRPRGPYLAQEFAQPRVALLDPLDQLLGERGDLRRQLADVTIVRVGRARARRRPCLRRRAAAPRRRAPVPVRRRRGGLGWSSALAMRSRDPVEVRRHRPRTLARLHRHVRERLRPDGDGVALPRSRWGRWGRSPLYPRISMPIARSL